MVRNEQLTAIVQQPTPKGGLGFVKRWMIGALGLTASVAYAAAPVAPLALWRPWAGMTRIGDCLDLRNPALNKVAFEQAPVSSRASTAGFGSFNDVATGCGTKSIYA